MHNYATYSSPGPPSTGSARGNLYRLSPTPYDTGWNLNPSITEGLIIMSVVSTSCSSYSMAWCLKGLF